MRRADTDGKVAMALGPETFREHLIAMMDASGTSAGELSRQTGVSKPLIDKLRQRKAITTNVNDAMRIAQYFGKTVEEFLGVGNRQAKIDRLTGLIAQLDEDQARSMEAQIAAVLSLKKG
jgi:plasmid maintenance system antidote protein VapI